MEKTIYDFTVSDAKLQKVSLDQFKNKVLLIVNVASECGFTPQYKELQKLQDELGPEKFCVLGFPCNQFGGQEPGSNLEIQNFCELKYNVTFPIFAKIDVNGDKADELFKFLKNKAKGLLGTETIKWNFTKFLVDSKGHVIRRYAPKKSPMEIYDDIKELM